jgi:hypothetical protein
MRKLRAAVIAVLLLVLVGTLLPAAAQASPRGAVKALRAATARYHSVTQALRAGYSPGPMPVCVSSPLGGMGYHFENQALMTDSVLDPRRPEMLLYERKANGKFRLTGVEYYLEADRATEAPALFGHTFQGPMAAHHPGMETHYDLHAWIWKQNQSGMFAEWNPRVTCP